MKKTTIAIFLAIITLLTTFPMMQAEAAKADTNTDGFVDVTAYFSETTITVESVVNNKFFCADSNHSKIPVMSNRSNAAGWETFSVSNATSDGWVGLKAHNGQYLSVRTNVSGAPVRASASSIGTWELFKIFYNCQNDTYCILAKANRKYLSVRTNTSGAPVQALASTPASWERFKISICGDDYISTDEIISTAIKYSIKSNSNLYEALHLLNTEYDAKLSTQCKTGVVIAFFEGAGFSSSSSKRMNATCLVVRNGQIVYLNSNCSTIPDYPFNPDKNNGNAMATLKSGIYAFRTVNHQGEYAALTVENAMVVRHASKTSWYSSTASGINVHRRYSDTIPSASKGWVNSAGCLLVGTTGTTKNSDYARFIQTLGIVCNNANATVKYETPVNGKLIVDRTFATDYLVKIGYSTGAIEALG